MSDSGDDESSVYSGLEEEDGESEEELAETSEYESELSENDDDDDEKQVDFEKYDSSDEEDLRNTVGNIPVVWYDDQEHVGYDLEGRKVRKPAKKSEIEEFLAKVDDPNYWKTVKDKQTGKDVVLPDDALATVSNVLKMRYPKVGYNPYQPFVDIYSHETMIHPVSNRPEHKRSFIPSKLEKKMVSKMVHAIKMGWIKPRKPVDSEDDAVKYYDLWASDQQSNDPLSKSQLARIKMQIPAPKMKLPGHNESYNPPPEYLFSPEEKQKWDEQDPDDRRIDFIPEKFDNLRHVPAYANFMKERFNRCVDLYSAPRQRKMRLNVDPSELLPKLPKPQDLHPFPTTMALVYKGHTSLVRAIAIEPNGQFLASGSDDGTIRIWEVHSGRCVKTINVDGVVHSIVWCPNVKLSLIAASVGSNVFLINSNVGDRLIISDTDVMLKSLCSSNSSAFENTGNIVEWSVCSEKQYETGLRLRLSHKKDVKQITWHVKGDYFATVCPEGGNSSVFVHQLSKINTQMPFNKSKGLIQKVLFHPTRPYFFVATQRHVRVYNLLKQQLTRKLMSNCKLISSMALHPKGDNLIVGSYDCRMDWFDLDLSAKPYKTFRHHRGAVRSVTFHPHYPLFATASDDGTVIVSHGMVYNDLLQNPLIVPVKILRGHGVHDNLGVVDCIFHPVQPWLLSCGSDSNIRLYV